MCGEGSDFYKEIAAFEEKKRKNKSLKKK